MTSKMISLNRSIALKSFSKWILQERHFNFFLGDQNFFKFFNLTELLKNWKKQHFICSNLTFFIVPFFLFFFFFFFSLFFFFSFFFLFTFSLGGGGRRPPTPLKWRPWNSVPLKQKFVIQIEYNILLFKFAVKTYRIVKNDNKAVPPGKVQAFHLNVCAFPELHNFSSGTWNTFEMNKYTYYYCNNIAKLGLYKFWYNQQLTRV